MGKKANNLQNYMQQTANYGVFVQVNGLSVNILIYYAINTYNST